MHLLRTGNIDQDKLVVDSSGAELRRITMETCHPPAAKKNISTRVWRDYGGRVTRTKRHFAIVELPTTTALRSAEPPRDVRFCSSENLRSWRVSEDAETAWLPRCCFVVFLWMCGFIEISFYAALTCESGLREFHDTSSSY